MNRYYYTMRCINHEDAALIAIGVHYEKEVYLSNVNCGILGFRFENDKIRLEAWAKQSGFENNGTHVIIE
jgi:hypothetical protein